MDARKTWQNQTCCEALLESPKGRKIVCHLSVGGNLLDPTEEFQNLAHKCGKIGEYNRQSN